MCFWLITLMVTLLIAPGAVTILWANLMWYGQQIRAIPEVGALVSKMMSYLSNWVCTK